MIKQALRDLAPLKIHLADPKENRRWIELDPPAEVEFLAGRGIRVLATGRFRFNILGVPIPAHLDRIEFLIAPKIVRSGTVHSAAIPIEILDADLRMIPNLVDDLIVSQVNAALTPRASQLVWRLSETLSTQFPMPTRLEQITKLDLSVEESGFSVRADAVTLRVAYLLTVERTDCLSAAAET